MDKRWGNHYTHLNAPGIVIGLHPTSQAGSRKDSGNVPIGFTTDDAEETKTLLKKLGINFSERKEERKEEGGDFLHFQDADGTSLYFKQPNW